MNIMQSKGVGGIAGEETILFFYILKFFAEIESFV